MSISLHPDISYWLAAARMPGLGPRTIRRGIEHFQDIKTLFSASVSELKSLGWNANQIASLHKPDWKSVESDIDWCQKNACHLVSLDEERYPLLLRETTDPPLVLFVRGEFDILKQPQLAIVGSRNPSLLGMELAEQFGYYLSKAGLIVTSGLALGIDTGSHRGAMGAGGKTVAVLGSGFDFIYPKSNQALAESILIHGALVTEWFPNEKPKASHFPRRNRIISGLSLGVLVVEAALRSGSLITARFAAEQGRDVFAIPGAIHNPLARGCHQLIRMGAKLVETATDIIEELGALCSLTMQEPASINPPKPSGLDPMSRKLLAQIGYEVTTWDAIILRSGLTAGELSSILLSLECEGYVCKGQGGYSRRR